MARAAQRAILRQVSEGKLVIDRKGQPVKNISDSKAVVEEAVTEEAVAEEAVVEEAVAEEAIVLEEKVEKKKKAPSRKKYKKSTSSKDS